ncbi:MAG: glucosaminidase domain-containing protein [Tumebacillaceae bacterium]
MPTPIMGQQQATAFQLRNYLHQINPNAPDYSQWYISLGNKYGIRGDIAFCQSLLETGYWRFGGDVQPTQNNFAGLGAVGGGTQGVSFPTPQAGIEAQMQHLYAYATSLPLPANTVQLDPRFQLVTRGSAATWESLSGRWATATSYGEQIIKLYQDLITTQSALNPPQSGGTTTTTPSTPTPAPTSTATTTATTTSIPTATHVPLPTDTPADSWFAPYVQQVLDLGIMHGTDTSGSKFEPNLPATRAELAVALYNLYQALQNNQSNQ